MKVLIALAGMILAAATASAQPQTLLDGDIQSGGFGGMVLKGTRMIDQNAFLVGAEGAWVVNHSFYIGGGAYGEVNDIAIPEILSNANLLSMGYAGGIVGYQFFPDSLIHLGVQTLIGGGEVGRRQKQNEWLDGFDYRSDNATDVIFVAEPAVNLELNVSRSIRLNVLGSYRFVDGVETEGLTNKSLSGPAIGVSARFGAF